MGGGRVRRTIRVRVKPRSRASDLVEQADGTWLARLQAPPVEGRANAELLALVARRFGVPKSRVTLRHGGRGRVKLVDIDP